MTQFLRPSKVGRWQRTLRQRSSARRGWPSKQSPNGLEKGHENGKKAKKMKIFGGSIKSQVTGKNPTQLLTGEPAPKTCGELISDKVMSRFDALKTREGVHEP
jgi:hypothetical protein